jgi:hypothetical protein
MQLTGVGKVFKPHAPLKTPFGACGARIFENTKVTAILRTSRRRARLAHCDKACDPNLAGRTRIDIVHRCRCQSAPCPATQVADDRDCPSNPTSTAAARRASSNKAAYAVRYEDPAIDRGCGGGRKCGPYPRARSGQRFTVTRS